MVEQTKPWGRSLVESLVYPLIVLIVGVILAAWLTPILVPLWDANERVPNVYGYSRESGEATLESAGFERLRWVAACSSSVEPGRIREVVVDNGADLADETSLVNEFVDDQSLPTLDISKQTPLLVKISDGSAC